jgi:lysophospholipase L1-like esterase
MGFQYYYNDGVAGACMATMGDRVTKNKLATFDLVTVFAGTNDYGLGTPLGAPGDSATANTFYGHVQKVINKIRAARPDVELVFLTPIVRGAYEDQPVYPAPNEAGYTLEQYVQAIQDVCAQNQVKVINLFATSGITAQNVEKYTKDNLHPNWDGAELIATAIQQGLIY